jgi:hypothetical protein
MPRIGKLICVSCAKLIEEQHRFRLTEEGLVRHVDCLNPSAGAHQPTGEYIERGDYQFKLYPGKW